MCLENLKKNVVIGLWTRLIGFDSCQSVEHSNDFLPNVRETVDHAGCTLSSELVIIILLDDSIVILTRHGRDAIVRKTLGSYQQLPRRQACEQYEIT